jgi:superfamily II DNA or RNA helicase
MSKTADLPRAVANQANVRDLSAASEPERRLFHDVIAPTLAPGAAQYVFPQHPVTDAAGRSRRIDFAIITPHTRLAIELDGYAYHAEGAITRDSFSDQLARQNELIIDGWRVLRFSWDQLVRDPDTCRDMLRRALISDPLVHPSFSHSGLQPHLVQQEALARLEETRRKGNTRGLVVMATGLGKTYLSAFDARRVEGRVLFIAHNNEILEQAQAAFRRVLPTRTTGFFNGDQKLPSADVVFANIATLRSTRGLLTFNQRDFAYIVVDEFHHSAAPSYERVFSYFRPSFLLGITATPDRTDRNAILHFVDDNLVYEMTQAEAIRRGFLVPFHYYALRDNVDYTNIRHNGFRYEVADLNKCLIVEGRDQSIAAEYMRLAGDEKAIGFCVSIEHADRAAEHFRACGIAATSIHSRLTTEERSRRITAFRSGEYRIACVRDLFNEGVDVPDVGAVLFMRPTESKLIFIQQLGRGLRLNTGKTAVKVLDFIGNYVNAQRIAEYLSDMGASTSLAELRKKPVLHFDTGCDVSFHVDVVDTLLHLDQAAVRGDVLISEYFQLKQRLRRQPTVSDMVASSTYRLRQYVACFGSWSSFIARLRTIAPDEDTTRLNWPSALSDASADVLATLADPDGPEFRDLLEESASQLSDLLADFAALSQKSRRGQNATYRRKAAFDALRATLARCSQSINDVTIVLDLSTSDRVEPLTTDSSCPSEVLAVGARVSQELEALSTSRDVRIFSQKFAAAHPLISSYQSHVARAEATTEHTALRSHAFAVGRHISDLTELAASIARHAE